MAEETMDETDYYNQYPDNFTIGPVFNYVLQDFILRGCIIGSMVIIGICFNVLTIIGFSGVKKKSSHTFLLQCLAGADSAFLLFIFLEHSLWHFFEFFETFSLCEYSKVYHKLNHLIGGFWTLTQDLAMWSVVLVTLDRWIAIYAPTKSHQFCQIRPAATAFFVVILYCCAFNGHYFVMNKFQEISSNDSANSSAINDLKCNVQYESQGSLKFKRVYYFVDSTVNLIIPMLSVVLLDSGMILALRRSRIRMGRRRDEAGSSATLVLVLLATSFVLFQIPELVHIIFRAIGSHVFSFELAYIALFFQAFNSFSNFFIYILIGRTFRQALWNSIRDMCGCCIPKRYKHSSLRSDYKATEITNMSVSLRRSSELAETKLG